MIMWEVNVVSIEWWRQKVYEHNDEISGELILISVRWDQIIEMYFDTVSPEC